ncbi:hypothetical protein [Halosolutus halophilus]|nr:hypothetical protein [Halosolutus halophilus]
MGSDPDGDRCDRPVPGAFSHLGSDAGDRKTAFYDDGNCYFE